MTRIFKTDRPNLIWLEDRETTAEIEVSEAKRHGCEVLVRAHPVEIMALLEDEIGLEAPLETVAQLRIALIIDVMISGLVDLSQLGVQHSETHGGLNGGFVFVDRVLREENSIYRHRPVCFLSERQLDDELREDLDYLRARCDPDGTPHGQVLFIRKSSSSELQKFKTFLRTL